MPQMINKKYISATIFLTLCISGCADTSNESKTTSNPISGKFLVMRMSRQESEIYLLQNNHEQKLLASFGFPKWSPNGEKFLARDSRDGKKVSIFSNKGEIIDSLEWANKFLVFDWISDEKIIFVDQEKINNNWDKVCKIYTYDFKTKATVLVYEFELTQYVYRLAVSPDGTKVAFDAGPTVTRQKAKQQMGYIDLTDNKLHNISPGYNVLGWFPDNKHIAIMTNTKEDGSKYSSFGIIGKLNIKTNKMEVIKELDGFYNQKKLSPDGKYFYYTDYLDKKGQAIFVQALDSDEHYQVTFPQPIKDQKDKFAQDVAASWYQA